tara:strand:+ start:669 stop:1193 length:525 start_codon:yes stop_codon:yes gene_type:complete
MNKYIKKIKSQEDKLYNKILFLSRNKLFYTKFGLRDTFQNRINLIFLHISFLFIRTKNKNEQLIYKEFDQKLFDHTFKKIELNMREVGYSDMSVNKKMKFMINIFYNILLDSEKYVQKSIKNKNSYLLKYLSQNNDKKSTNNIVLIEYFDAYQAFCFDLSSDSVLNGDLDFYYK